MGEFLTTHDNDPTLDIESGSLTLGCIMTNKARTDKPPPIPYAIELVSYTSHTCPSTWSCTCTKPPRPGQIVVRAELPDARLAAGSAPVKMYCQPCWLAMFQPSVNSEIAVTRASLDETQVVLSTYTEPVKYLTRVGTIKCPVCDKTILYGDLLVQTRATVVNTGRPGSLRHHDCAHPQGISPQPGGSGGKKQKIKR